MIDLPDVVQRTARAHGAAGERWLRDLPDLVLALADQWGLAVGATIVGGTASFVAHVTTTEGEAAVLKVAMPAEIDGPDTFARAVTALQVADGHGCVRLLAHDHPRSALLLEALGSNLVDLDYSIDQQLVATCAGLRELWRPVPPGTPLPTGADKARWLAASIERWWVDLDQPCAERTIATVLGFAEARAAALDLHDAVLVHGDAHGWNTLVAPDGTYRLVDIEGLVSEPAHDLAVPMRESNEELLAGDALALGLRRAQRLAALTGADAERIWQWGSIERVSNGLWSLVLGEPQGHDFLAVADRWAER